MSGVTRRCLRSWLGFWGLGEIKRVVRPNRWDGICLESFMPSFSSSLNDAGLQKIVGFKMFVTHTSVFRVHWIFSTKRIHPNTPLFHVGGETANTVLLCFWHKAFSLRGQLLSSKVIARSAIHSLASHVVLDRLLAYTDGVEKPNGSFQCENDVACTSHTACNQ